MFPLLFEEDPESPPHLKNILDTRSYQEMQMIVLGRKPTHTRIIQIEVNLLFQLHLAAKIKHKQQIK